MIKLSKWKEGKESTWNFLVDGVKLCQQLLHQKRKVEVQLNEEVLNRKKCGEIVHKFKETQSQVSFQTSSHTRKPLSEVSRQQQYNRKKEMANYCENEGFQPGLLELLDKNTGNHMVLDVSKGTFTCKDEQAKSTGVSTRIYSTLHIKNTQCICETLISILSLVISAYYTE